MAEYKIAVIPGDGVGPEVTEEGLKALRAVAGRHGIGWDFELLPWGSDYYLKHGRMMPSDALDTLAGFDAIYLGAVGHPDLQDHVTLNGLLLPIRRAFDQYVCERPSVLYPGIDSPLRDKKAWDIDMVVVRENTEGEYANVGGFQYEGFPEEDPESLIQAEDIADAAVFLATQPKTAHTFELRVSQGMPTRFVS